MWMNPNLSYWLHHDFFTGGVATQTISWDRDHMHGRLPSAINYFQSILIQYMYNRKIFTADNR